MITIPIKTAGNSRIDLPEVRNWASGIGASPPPKSPEPARMFRALRCSHGHVANVRGGLLCVKFVGPAFIERFRHAGPGLYEDHFLLAMCPGREQEYPSEKN